MASESVATPSPELPDRVLSGTERAAAIQNIERAMAVLELLECAGSGNDEMSGATVETNAAVAAEWLTSVLQTLDQAREVQP